MTHQVLTILELAALLKQTLGVSLSGGWVLVDVASHGLWHVVPVDLELGHARLFSQDVSVEALDGGRGRWVLIEFGAVVLDIDVVSNAEELLAILVGTCEQHSCDAHDVRHWQLIVIWRISLEDEFHLAGLGAVHLDLSQDLIVLGV